MKVRTDHRVKAEVSRTRLTWFDAVWERCRTFSDVIIWLRFLIRRVGGGNESQKSPGTRIIRKRATNPERK